MSVPVSALADCNRYLLSGIEEVPTITASTVSGRDQLDGPECVVFDPTVPDQDEVYTMYMNSSLSAIMNYG